MNFHAREYLADDAFSARRALDDAIAIYRNDEDSYDRELVIDAIASGRAAYWSTARYSNACACELLRALNRGTPIMEALERSYSGHHAANRRQGLDTVVPLNLKAATLLSLAYAEFGDFRDEAELLARAKRDTRPRAA